ncbi:MAG: glycosyltransferase [Planctomycetota bacterium]|nr:glycosyltransferase [Planctomycetota bacterium]
MPGKVVRIITRLNRGGPLRQLCALVPELARRGWSGPVVAGRVGGGESDGTDELRACGADVIRLRTLGRGIDPSNELRAFKSLLAVLRHHQPDLVHTHTAKAGALGRLAAAVCGIPAVHTFHGHHLEAALGKADLARLAERFLGRVTRAAVTLTPRQRRDVTTVHRVLPESKVHVIPPGLDLAGFRRQAAQPLAPGLLPDVRSDVPRFLWTGRFVAVKAPRLLVEAVAHAREPFHVTMLGRGPLLRSVRATIRAHGLEERIACPGSVANVAPWVAAADAIVLCSRSEGAPLSVLEGFALGKPVVVTTVGGLPDLVDHEGTGLWVPPGDAHALARALDRLAADAALRRRLGEAAAAEVDRRFGAEQAGAATAALYEELIGRR